MLDKKALRKFAADNPAPAIPPGHGLLHAPRVDYIVRTAVRIIDHRRTLVLYVYNRKRAADGDLTPVWTMFQAGGDYITLARREDGSTDWREAAFENLARDYYFDEKCAFYSARDEQHVCDFFHDHEDGGMKALVRAQRAILDERALQREAKKDRKILARMAGIPVLPGGLEDWARREVLPAYFLYGQARKGVAKGTCSACGHEAVLSGVKYKAKATCPHCGREMSMCPGGLAKHIQDRETGIVIQRVGAALAVRILKISAGYPDGMPAISIRENARQLISLDHEGAVECKRYYLSSEGSQSKWKEGLRPAWFGQRTYEAATDGYLYCGNLPEALAGTPWQYCPIVPFYQHDIGPMTVSMFLRAHIEHPRYEHLVKMGFYELVCDLVYHAHEHYPAPELDETQNRTHRLLGVDVEDVAFLRGREAGMEELQLLQTYYRAGVKDRQKLVLWQEEHRVTRDVEQILEHMTAHKFMRYMEQQFAALRLDGGRGRYGNMQRAVSEYRDYLDMCAKLGYDMSNSFILYPKDLKEAHDKAQGRLKAKADAKLRRDFKTAMGAISGHLDYEQGGMKIILPATPDEIIAEGQALHHCVGSYVDRVARRECVILFVRRSEDVSKPFYTVEVRGRKVVQVRGMGNGDPTPEVEVFMNRWERQVLQAA